METVCCTICDYECTTDELVKNGYKIRVNQITGNTWWLVNQHVMKKDNNEYKDYIN